MSRGLRLRANGYPLSVIRHLWIWLTLQLEAFDNNLIALDDDVPFS